MLPRLLNILSWITLTTANETLHTVQHVIKPILAQLRLSHRATRGEADFSAKKRAAEDAAGILPVKLVWAFGNDGNIGDAMFAVEVRKGFVFAVLEKEDLGYSSLEGVI